MTTQIIINYLSMMCFIMKGPVKLIQLVKIADSVLQFVSNLFHFITLRLQMAVKECFGTHF